MVRPKKTLRIEKDRNSIKVFDEMGLAGQISIRSLAILLRQNSLARNGVFKENLIPEVNTVNTDA